MCTDSAQLMNKTETELAEKLFDGGDTEKLISFLKPFIDLKDPFAINFISSFSHPGESNSDFNKRYIRQKIEASKLGSADVSYRMGVNYLYGDDVERNLEKASSYFERAIEQGHSYTKFTFGFSIYYGTDGNKKNPQRGLRLMDEASKEGIELAKKELKLIANNET